MMTVKQVSTLTGISVRTLQFYDEIGLLKPTATTKAGYRLYDEGALEELQQILFFKELDFKLQEIKAIMESPQYDRTAALQKQRDLIRMKRDRLNDLLGLLERTIKGESNMEFKEFDMSGYFQALAAFKQTHTDKIVQRMGSVEQFDALIAGIKGREQEVARNAVRQYGSLERWTQAVERNLQDYLDNGPSVGPEEVNALIQKTEELTRALTADLGRDPASAEVQAVTAELVAFSERCSGGMDMGEGYWALMAENYLTNQTYIEVTDKKYGPGAARFLGQALRIYAGA